jgi:cobalt-zinc-cadmium efflux system protein
VVSTDSLNNDFLRGVQQDLHDQFGIDHSTIQVESQGSDSVCMLDRRQCI